ncbi:MAG: DUF3365 domain-containing protein [Lysobacter sp.]|nr:DUF3365 domain-containing protein [Lysobacter sp.]
MRKRLSSWTIVASSIAVAFVATPWAQDRKSDPSTNSTPPAATAAADGPPAEIARAQAAIKDFGGRLREALMAKMANEGPVASIDFCRTEAPSIARDVAARHGVAIGRTSSRVRNPNNAPNDWRSEMLAAFQTRIAVGEAPETLKYAKIENGTLRYGQGIRTDPLCLTCHGASVTGPLRDAIRTHYPDDRATGFENGELRGAFWVEAALAEASAPMPAPVDHRIGVRLDPTEAAELREEMRGHLATIQAIVGALSAKDWPTVERLAAERAPGAGRGRAAAGTGFRAKLPAPWFDISRPMHLDYADLAAEAKNGKNTETALGHLERATSKCTGCHAAYRVEEIE